MAKLPDISKLNLQGIMDSVKSIINPEGNIPKDLEGDPIVAKITLITSALEELEQLQAQEIKESEKIRQLLLSLFKDLEALKQPVEPVASVSAGTSALKSKTATSSPTDDTSAKKQPSSGNKNEGE